METTYRAKGILKRWHEFKQSDNEYSKTVPLMMFIQYQYKRYLDLCDRCNEQPLEIGPWLRQPVRAKVTHTESTH